jgi:hypothetical protein
MFGTMMTVFVTSSCDVGYNDGAQHHMTRLQILSSLYPTSHDKVTNTVIFVPNITWRGYKYCHHCTQHHVTRLQILSSLYPTSHDEVTNTVIIVPNITWQGYKYCHHCTQHHMTRLQILSSLYLTSHDKVTNTVITVPNITMTVFVTLSCDVGYNDDSICNLVMWCWVQWWQYL